MRQGDGQKAFAEAQYLPTFHVYNPHFKRQNSLERQKQW